ncbi:FKBP-type peptidyl-prolyl cis-trans isomerase [Spirosoma montaniterrae]|uniref:Peptidyl-prolyl cis-trans isomerase n=1 Tax=Spirosoma montaniterrae TaxID=1178516 RepID=A0A1P9WSJ4_9BACT|nr:peptidylprolyl isomerase [Spirosoma montaniterrae]AQG78344.1 peptidylprolyl isomerase [Spirosoma montaniterrae]
MTITKHKVAAIHYTLRDNSGTVLDSSEGREPLYYLHGENNLIPGMEEGLEGRTKGDKLQLTVPPEKGYGRRDPQLIEQVPRTAFGGQTIEVGMQFQANDGQIITVTEVGAEAVTVDANHPLADQDLHFDVEVVDVRDATRDELDHGHVHGPGGVAH